MYKLTNYNSVIRLADGANIPLPPNESEGYKYQVWLDEGNTPLPADIEPLPVINVVTMRQARLALLQAGLLSQVNTAVASLQGAAGEAARIEWEYAAVVEKNSPLISALSASIGLTQEQLDGLFTLASTL